MRPRGSLTAHRAHRVARPTSAERTVSRRSAAPEQHPPAVALACARDDDDVTLAFACRALDKRFRAGVTGCCAEVRALIDVTFHVGAGELVEVRGAPGAGKTTLLHCVSGLLAPDAGEMRWFGTCDRRRVACIISPPTSPFQAVRWQRHRLMEARAARASLIVIDLALARGDAAALLREEIAGALGCGASVLAASNGFDLGALPRRTIVLACGRIAHGRMRAHSVRRFPPRAVSSRVAEPG